MTTTGTTSLLKGPPAHFLDLTNSESSGWLYQSHAGDGNVHLTLFQYYGVIHLHLCKFATNFENANILKTGRPVSELDLI
jgi:hypothetical protein